MKRLILIFIAVIMVIASSGCKNKYGINDVNEAKSTGNITETDGLEANTSDNEAQNTEKSIETADVLSNVQSKNEEDVTEQEPINSLNDLNKKFRSLKIQKSGDTGEYEASKSLVYIIYDMLSKVEPVYLDTPEGKKTAEAFNYNYYDYLLKFEGAKDILFVREGNALHFEGEKQIYYLWGNADSLWDSLIFDTEKKFVDIEGEKIRLMRNAFKEDLDGDGNAEDIELFYERGKNLDLHGSLYISINKSKVLIMEEDWFTMPYRIVGEMPKVSFLKEKNGNSKAVLVIYSWATNGVGSTGELYAYKFTDGQISELTVKEPEKIMTYNGNDILDIKYPELNKNFDLRVDPILYKQIHGTEENA
mgnify:FL=1